MSSAEGFLELIGRVRAGDEDAATEIFQRYGRIFVKKIRNRLAGSAVRAHVDCEDICQSVFGSLFLRLRWGEYELAREEDLIHLLRKMADNKVIAQIRKKEARPDLRDRDDFDVGLAAAEAPTASWVATWKELCAEAIKRLSDEERQLLDLREQGLEWAEVARQLGGTPEGRRKQWERARGRIVAELQLED